MPTTSPKHPDLGKPQFASHSWLEPLHYGWLTVSQSPQKLQNLWVPCDKSYCKGNEPRPWSSQYTREQNPQDEDRFWLSYQHSRFLTMGASHP
ncbi:hypothetical protein N7523_001023 [Penicillium sp. IBT 18751x]|nr:hypothetical protein N7523_001023 [Penicillium sp. IBT 18751x]